MKIAFIVAEFPTLSETFILNQITGLIDLGHDVEIFAQKGNFNGKIHPDVLNYNLRNRVHYFNVPPHRIKRMIKAIFLIIANFYRSPIKILKSLNIFRYGKQALSLNLLYATISFLNKDFDIIYCHFGSIGNMGTCLKQMGFGDRLVTMFYGADIRFGIIKGGSYYRKLFEVGDCFLAISEYNYKNLVRFGADPKKIILHPVGIDIEKFDNRSYNVARKQKKVIILTVARIVVEKGLSYGIEAIKLLLEKKPRLDIEYRIIGDGPLKKKLEKMVKDFKLNDVVIFLGSAEQKDIIKEMKKSKIFLLPSIAEALPVVLMEAQAMKLPVIATKVGGIPEVVVDGKSGFLVPERDIKAMAEKIEYLVKNKKIWRKMGKYGRRFVKKHYNIDKLNKNLINIFKNLLIENTNY